MLAYTSMDVNNEDVDEGSGVGGGGAGKIVATMLLHS